MLSLQKLLQQIACFHFSNAAFNMSEVRTILSSSLNKYLVWCCTLSTSLVLAETLALISGSLLGEEDMCFASLLQIFARLSSVHKAEELKCSQHYSACRADFFSSSPIWNPKLQQGCQGAHSLRASFSKPEAAALGHFCPFRCDAKSLWGLSHFFPPRLLRELGAVWKAGAVY